MQPSAVLAGDILEFDGSFKVSEISAVSHFMAGVQFLRQNQADAALPEFETATRLNPKFIRTHERLASLYAQMKRPDEAMSEYRTAMHIYQTVHPDFQVRNDPPENPLAHK